ncbi:putative aminopeptidase YsdC [bioreactor metagenome]|uniref:Putative aminopeptidase YsdC n=1 Tax=bioreactor metagenome TaxID=1076179 RepID=A0A645CBT1_9ZZZZ
MRFLNGVQGIIGADVPEDPAKAFTIDQLFVDVGASSPTDCPISVGDPAVFERPVMELGSRFVSKALDDRISCAVLIEVLRSVNPGNNELVFVFSTQEEVGIRGVISAAYSVDPDLGIAIDVTSVGDTPKAKMEVALGKGPAIKIRDGGMIADPAVVRWMRRSAEAAGIPYQLEILDVLATTDARAIQVTRAGVPTGCISIPTRYIHSPAEMVDLNDVEKVKNLVLALLSQPIEIK